MYAVTSLTKNLFKIFSLACLVRTLYFQSLQSLVQRSYLGLCFVKLCGRYRCNHDATRLMGYRTVLCSLCVIDCFCLHKGYVCLMLRSHVTLGRYMFGFAVRFDGTLMQVSVLVYIDISDLDGHT